jgi:Ni,Fe-hydrogenase III large subunit
MNAHWKGLLEDIPEGLWEERPRHNRNECHLVFIRGELAEANYEEVITRDCRQLGAICEQLRKASAVLVTVVASDERDTKDRCFKVYYVFSNSLERECRTEPPSGGAPSDEPDQQDQDCFLILEYPLLPAPKEDNKSSREPSRPKSYISPGRAYPCLCGIFPAAEPFEREIFELFDLLAISKRKKSHEVSPAFLLHDPYPRHLAPLEVPKSQEELIQKIEESDRTEAGVRPLAAGAGQPDEVQPDEVLFPLGPIYAGVAEAGQLVFHAAGEMVDDVEIRLGFKHKGIEKLFQTKYSLVDGWQLAECITGDSAFSHSLAYCHAVEALAHIDIPEEATLLRGLFLELERLYNHIGDSAALAHDVALDIVASEMAVLREFLLRLNAYLTGHRFLRGVNRPGGLEFLRIVKRRGHEFPSHAKSAKMSHSPLRERIDGLIQKISRKRFGSLTDLAEEYCALADLLLRTPAFRDRSRNVGLLEKGEACRLGATGLIARASGLRGRDFRLSHPSGVYAMRGLELQELVKLPRRDDQEATKPELQGDVFSRLELRQVEVSTSVKVIQRILDHLGGEIPAALRITEEMLEEALKNSARADQDPHEFALGYVEGWRGDIVYWIMRDQSNGIFRCKVRDPSFINRPALRAAMKPHDSAQSGAIGYILPDMPIISRSFNLSYSGHDL